MVIDYLALGRTVRELRKKRGLSQETLAERSGISLSFLGHIERGTRKMSLETLVALADALDATPNALLTGQKEQSDKGMAAFLAELEFDSEEQKQRFYAAVRALAQGRREL
ncbi:MAG: helix-turn-helix domain-containing protein [Blautia massiliensis (ex Durand et al. 2017)]|nr:MAG: transcriptional regulator [Subdoligranulum variabile]